MDGQLFIRSVTGVRSVTLWSVSYFIMSRPHRPSTPTDQEKGVKEPTKKKGVRGKGHPSG